MCDSSLALPQWMSHHGVKGAEAAPLEGRIPAQLSLCCTRWLSLFLALRARRSTTRRACWIVQLRNFSWFFMLTLPLLVRILQSCCHVVSRFHRRARREVFWGLWLYFPHLFGQQVGSGSFSFGGVHFYRRRISLLRPQRFSLTPQCTSL